MSWRARKAVLRDKMVGSGGLVVRASLTAEGG
jgi:hypothetical protein